MFLLLGWQTWIFPAQLNDIFGVVNVWRKFGHDFWRKKKLCARAHWSSPVRIALLGVVRSSSRKKNTVFKKYYTEPLPSGGSGDAPSPGEKQVKHVIFIFVQGGGGVGWRLTGTNFEGQYKKNSAHYPPNTQLKLFTSLFVNKIYDSGVPLSLIRIQYVIHNNLSSPPNEKTLKIKTEMYMIFCVHHPGGVICDYVTMTDQTANLRFAKT